MNLIATKRRQLYVMAPFLLLVLCLGSLNVARWFGDRSIEEEIVATTAVASSTPTLNSTNTLPTATPLSPTAIATPQPILTPYVPPSYSDNDTIQLLGPPPDSTFAADAPLSFYWQWPLPLSEDQFFVVYLLTDDEISVAGMVDEPNMGGSYWLHVAAVGERTAVSLQWQVTLNTILSTQPLRTSESRSLYFLGSP